MLYIIYVTARHNELIYILYSITHYDKSSIKTHNWYMNGISINDMQFFTQNDYQHHLRQTDIFKERYLTGIRQSYWYVFGICQKK